MTSTAQSTVHGHGGEARPNGAGMNISQQLLARYHELCEAKRERITLRQQLLNRLAAGADVEGGAYSLHLRYCELRRLTQSNLRDQLGDEGVEWLLSQVEPTNSCRVTVQHSEPTIFDPDNLAII